jgi:hypothetical protein
MPDEQPKIGPFSIHVPPPSPNGHHTASGSGFEHVRRAAPGIVVGLILCVSTVPQASLLRSGELAYWWRIVIAVGAGGVVCGLVQKPTRWIPFLTGAAVGAVGLLLAYGLVRSESAVRASAGTVVADVARLAAWGVIGGGLFAVSASLIKRRLVRRAEPDRIL